MRSQAQRRQYGEPVIAAAPEYSLRAKAHPRNRSRVREHRVLAVAYSYSAGACPASILAEDPQGSKSERSTHKAVEADGRPQTAAHRLTARRSPEAPMKVRRQRKASAPFPRLDRRAKALSVGQRVRVVGIPVLQGALLLRKSLPVFRQLVGTYRRISDFDETGCAELFVRLRKGPHRGLHFVWLEPDLLQLPLGRRTRETRRLRRTSR